MLLLTGEYQHLVDSKGRVLISNRLRSQIDCDEHGSNFYLVLGANGILCLYPEKYFEQIVLSVTPSVVAPDEAVGVRDHIELWNSENWEQYLTDNMGQYQKQMSQARQIALQKQEEQL
jgi:DNA-binding transcriptional regulator/RsmH inhibitor MraZ